MLAMLAQAGQQQVPEWFRQYGDPANWGEIGQQYSAWITWSSFGVIAFGVLMLLLGIKLARPLIGLWFAAWGALTGLGLGQALRMQYGMEAWPLIGALVGAVVIGLMGFALYQFWVILAFAIALAFGGAAGYMAVMTGEQIADGWGELSAVYNEAWDDYRDFERLRKELGKNPSGQGITLPKRSLQQREQEQKQRMKRWGREITDYAQEHGLAIGLSALGGFVLGVLLGAFLFRFIVMLVSAIVGTGSIYAAAMTIGHVQRHKWVESIKDLGPHVWWILGGMVLLGVIVQALLPRKKKDDLYPDQQAAARSEDDFYNDVESRA
jgi:hypothetical protein